MIRNYTPDEYSQMAIRANREGKALYIFVQTIDEQEYANLVIADYGYYICYESHYTRGEINPNFELEKRQRQRDFLDSLTLTPSDVERALFEAKGMDFDDLKQLIIQVAPDINIKRIGIELKANHFYRGAKIGDIRLVDTIGALLGYSPADMDYLFKYKVLPRRT